MLHYVFKTYFIGQTAFEHGAKAYKEQVETAKHKADELKKKVEEYKDVQVKGRIETQFKTRMIDWRNSCNVFNQMCKNVGDLLSETQPSQLLLTEGKAD